MIEFLIVRELKGNGTETLKGLIIPKRITGDNAQEAMAKVTRGKIFEEEDLEIIAIQTLLF